MDGHACVFSYAVNEFCPIRGPSHSSGGHRNYVCNFSGATKPDKEGDHLYSRVDTFFCQKALGIGAAAQTDRFLEVFNLVVGTVFLNIDDDQTYGIRPEVNNADSIHIQIPLASSYLLF